MYFNVIIITRISDRAVGIHIKFDGDVVREFVAQICGRTINYLQARLLEYERKSFGCTSADLKCEGGAKTVDDAKQTIDVTGRGTRDICRRTSQEKILAVQRRSNGSGPGNVAFLNEEM